MFQVFQNVSLINSLVAVIPAILIIVVIYKQDKIEKESKGLLALLIFLGMLSAFLVLRFGSAIATAVAGVIPQNTWPFIIIKCYFIIALLEEGLKYLSIKLPTWNSTEFDCRFDGVVYGACVGIGFAVYEAFTHGGHDTLSFMIKRTAFSLSGHLTYGVVMGLLIAIALSKENKKDYKGSKKYRLMAFLIPWAFHGTYDLIAELAGYHMASINIIYVYNVVSIIFAIVLIKTSSIKDEKIVPEKKKWWQ